MRSDLDLLQGCWIVTALEMEGQEMPDATLAEARIVIKGNRFTSLGMGAEYKGTFTLDTAATPHRLDMNFDTGPEKGATNFGIYEIEGDTWRLCLATRGNVRPSTFASTPGSGFALETLTRAATPAVKSKARSVRRPGPAAPPVSLGEFEGEWTMMSCIIDGQPMHKSLMKWVKRVTQGNRSTVYAGPQVLLRVEFHTDASTSPKQIDYFNLVGQDNGKTQLGIYDFEAGLLKICVAAPGDPRPTEFHSARGDGRTFSVWKRA